MRRAVVRRCPRCTRLTLAALCDLHRTDEAPHAHAEADPTETPALRAPAALGDLVTAGTEEANT